MLFHIFLQKNKIMKKRILLCLLSLLVCTLNDAKTTETNNFLSYKNIIRVDLLIKYIDPSDELPKPSRTPIKGPSIGLCDNTLYLFGQFNNIVLRLVDNDIAIYSVVEVVLLTVRKEKIKDKKATAPYIKNILKRCYL